MAWLYLDDQLPDHPKIVQAGGDAAWLFVCGLAYCRRYDTDGFIPAAAVPRLTDRRSPLKLAAVLVNVSLWEPGNDGWNVHDWSDWNRTNTSRSEAGRKAAAARWSKDASRNANASETHSERIQKDDASGCTIPIPNPVTTSVDIVTKGTTTPVDNRQADTMAALTDLLKLERITAAQRKQKLAEAAARLPELLQHYDAPATMLAAFLLGQPANLMPYKRRN